MNLKERRTDIDWLRVLAFYILIFYHVGMFFVPWNFHFKNSATAEWFETWMAFLGQWRLPLLFLISGVGVCYALGKRSAKQFMGERTKRLLLPLIFGMLVIVPPQIYFERITNGIHFSNYFDFWKTVFNFVPYPNGGSLSWHHLWFVLYIFVFSFILLPLFLYLRGEKSARLKEKISIIVKKHPNSIYLLMLPLFLIYLILAPIFPTTHSLWGDWYNLSFSLVLFVFGFLISIVDGVWDVIAANRRKSLIIGLFPTIFLLLFVWGPTFEIMNENTYEFFLFYSVLKTLMISTLLLAILGYGKIHLNKPGRFIKYANESVYPLYILHQSVQLTIGYYILKLDWAIMPKFILLIIGTFGLSFLIYELFIKRFSFMRLLFGMKSLNKKVKPEVEASPANRFAVEKEA